MNKVSDPSFVGIKIDSNSAVPLFLQVFQAFRDLIVAGVLTAGDMLPPLIHVAKEHQVAFTTIERGYKQLEKNGYVKRYKGIGYYVIPFSSSAPKALLLIQAWSPEIGSLYNGINKNLKKELCLDVKFFIDKVELKEILEAVVDTYNYYLIEKNFTLEAWDKDCSSPELIPLDRNFITCKSYRHAKYRTINERSSMDHVVEI